jgi:nicotinamide mononucleotide transporter
VSWIEIVASILGVLNIVLLVRRSIWNYPFGIVMVSLYGVVFFQARLFSDALLQVFFFVVQIYGWWVWYHARDSAGLVKVELMSARSRILWVAVIVGATAAEGWYLAYHTSDSAPWMDANTTAMSVVAQYLLSIRKVENWILWIVTDVVQIGLYYWKGLYPTTGLYVLFLILSCVGLYEWLREWRAHGAGVRA